MGVPVPGTISARVAVNPMAAGDGRRQRLGYAEDQGGERRHDRDDVDLATDRVVIRIRNAPLPSFPAGILPPRRRFAKPLSGKLTRAPIYRGRSVCVYRS